MKYNILFENWKYKKPYGNKLKESGMKVISTRYKDVPHGIVSKDKVTKKQILNKYFFNYNITLTLW